VSDVLGDGTISALFTGSFEPPCRTDDHEWSGVVVLKEVRDGSFGIRQTRTETAPALSTLTCPKRKRFADHLLPG